MIAIKFYPRGKFFQVWDGVMKEYAKFNPDGTYTGGAGIAAAPVSRRFYTLAEAEEAKRAYEEYARKYK